MKCLEVLELSRSGIRGLPSSIEYLIALRTLYLYDCPNLSHLPDVIYKLQLPEESIFPTTPSILANNSPNCSFWYGFSRLEELNLINCENITELEFFLKLEYFPILKYLNLPQTNIVTIPKHISSFTRLAVLDIISCKKLQEIPRLPQSIRRVCAKNCWSLDPLTSSRLLSQVSLFFSLSYKETSSQKRKKVIKTHILLPSQILHHYIS